MSYHHSRKNGESATRYHHHGLLHLELHNEYTESEIVDEGFRRLPVQEARAIFKEVGLEEKDNWNKMPVIDYAWLLSEASRIIHGFNAPLNRKDLKESGMDMDADIICEDEDPFADMAKDLKHNFSQRKMIMKMNSKN